MVLGLLTETADERLAYLNAYRWSSYRGYVLDPEREEQVDYRWLQLARGRTKSQNRRRYRAYVESMLTEDDRALIEALQQSAYAVGDADFMAQEEADIAHRRRAALMPADVLGPKSVGVSLERIDQEVANLYQLVSEALCHHGRQVGDAKSVALELACRWSRLPQRAIGQHYGGISGAAVSYQRMRFRRRLAADKTLIRRLREIEQRLGVECDT